MSTISRVTTWSDNQTLTASALNGEFNNILNDYNGSITNANISSSAAIALSKISTGITGSIVGTSDTQTLTNKTLTKPIVNGSIQTITSDSDASTITFDLSASNVHTVTLGGTRTLALSNVSTGQMFVLRLVQDATGSRTVSWFSTIKWPNGVTPTLTTTASKTDVFGFITTGSGTYDGFILGQNL